MRNFQSGELSITGLTPNVQYWIVILAIRKGNPMFLNQKNFRGKITSKFSGVKSPRCDKNRRVASFLFDNLNK